MRTPTTQSGLQCLPAGRSDENRVRTVCNRRGERGALGLGPSPPPREQPISLGSLVPRPDRRGRGVPLQSVHFRRAGCRARQAEGSQPPEEHGRDGLSAQPGPRSR